MTKPNVQILRPFFKLQSISYTTVKQWKIRSRILTCFWLSCFVWIFQTLLRNTITKQLNEKQISMSSVFLNFDRRQTRPKTVLHTLSACESQRRLLSTVIQFSLRVFLSGNDCHRRVLDRIDDHIIIVTPFGYLSWSKLSCILVLICKISLPDVCDVVSSVSMSSSTYMFHV